MIDPRLKELVLNGTPAQRKYVCERGFEYFCIYYFPEFFQYEMADFHWDMHQDVKDLESTVLSFLIWMMFRESAKTTLAKMYACYLGCYGKRHYINFDSYDKENAESSLMDIAVWFQTNKRLVADFGQLYYEESKVKKSTKKRIGNFILANGVKYEAFSTQQSVRGRIYNQYRPDAIFLDDFETNKTKRSVAMTQSIIGHMNELITGLGPTAIVIVLCNYITESGTVQYMLDKAQGNDHWRVRRVDAEINGKPAWEGKYAMSNMEAEARNIERPADAPVVSLEAKRMDYGEAVYATEMLNSPDKAGDLLFDRSVIDRMIENAKQFQKFEDRAGFKLWDKYNPSHRYAIGADTSRGIGRDACASVAIDFTAFPNRVVGTYANNTIAPDTFADEMKRQGDIFGTCLLGPEINNQGWATVARLKTIYDVDKIYRRVHHGKFVQIADKPKGELGWETNGATKPTMMYELKKAVEDGHLEIFDLGLLDEMRRYNQADLSELSPDPDSTRHFDKLMGCAVAWQMRNYAEVSSKGQAAYIQEPAMPISEFEAPAEYYQSPFPGDQDQPSYIPDEFEQ